MCKLTESLNSLAALQKRLMGAEEAILDVQINVQVRSFLNGLVRTKELILCRICARQTTPLINWLASKR